MNDNVVIKELKEELIGDIILCEPITRKGKESLERLGLSPEDITSTYFYDHLYVTSKYDDKREFETTASNQAATDNSLYYQYTVDNIQFEELKERLRTFNARFCSNSPNEYPLLMLGVAGNGKSIEVNRRIRELPCEESQSNDSKVYFDLEDSFTRLTYGITYKCPHNTPLWLFCIKLLDGIMQYIKDCKSKAYTIYDNFKGIVMSKNLANQEQIQIFENIKNFYNGDNTIETKVFSSLINLLTSNDVDNDIQVLLEILMWIMHCSNPSIKHYIVIDNIEQYIKLNNSKIQIPNSDISKLYKTINMVVMNMINSFGRIEKDLGWKAFKIIIVLRRTSIGLLDSALLHSPVRTEQNITDITGYFQIPDIWKQKKKHIWSERLCEKFVGEKNENIIGIVDNIMKEGENAVGTNYQSIIAPLMSYGIRRNARAQAHAAYRTYEILTNGKDENINLDVFNMLLSYTDWKRFAIRFMFRRALIEFQFKWSISSGSKDRWEDMGIGHLGDKKERMYEGKKFITQDVIYCDPKNVTLMRRILACLSCFPEENYGVNGQYKTVVDMFSTISLYDLIKGVLVNPKGDNQISDDDFLQFARVIISLSDMSNGDTKSAPYVILGVKDKNFHKNPTATVLANIFTKIYSAGEQNSLPGAIYNCSDYGARITDAGYSFLLDWQASFSFIASLHCFTIPSLFFLKDVTSIKYVIKTVYEASLSLCKKYEEEACRFCGVGELTLKTKTYLPKIGNIYVTFKQRIKDLHTKHLRHYMDYIEGNYALLSISENDMLELTSRDSGFIKEYIDKYNSWVTAGGAPECF